MKDVVKDYLWTEKLFGINNKKLYETSLEVEKFLKYSLASDNEDHTYGSYTTRNYRAYSMFTYICPEVYNLFRDLKISIKPHLLPGVLYYIQSWINVFHKGSNIDWHTHWPKNSGVYHGFYCVNTEDKPSWTDYQIPDVEGDIRIMSEDSLLVFGKSEGDRHRSSPWEDDHKKRVTLAFDIVPISKIPKNHMIINHYIPLDF